MGTSRWGRINRKDSEGLRVIGEEIDSRTTKSGNTNQGWDKYEAGMLSGQRHHLPIHEVRGNVWLRMYIAPSRIRGKSFLVVRFVKFVTDGLQSRTFVGVVSRVPHDS